MNSKVFYTKAANLYLKELIKILYQKNYFSYYKSAGKYVFSLRKDMEATIHLKMRQKDLLIFPGMAATCGTFLIPEVNKPPGTSFLPFMKTIPI